MKKLILFLVLIFTAGGASAQSVQLSTYYPSPFGMYDRIRLVPRAAAIGAPCDIGTLYVQAPDTLQFCTDDGGGNGTWGTFAGVWTQAGDNLYPSDIANPNLKVGIGTTTPDEELHIGQLLGNVVLRLGDFGTNDWDLIRSVGNDSIPSGSFALKMFGAAVPSIVADTTGNVGIGTTTPTSRLHVNAPEGDAPPGVFLENTDITVNGGADGWFGLRNKNTGTTPKISISGPGLGTEVLTVDTVAKNVGIGTTAPRTRLELGSDGAILATGTLGSGWTEPNLGVGTRLLWYPRKAAFRAGGVPNTQWDDVNIGNYSVTFGYNNTANGNYSAIGGGFNSFASAEGDTVSGGRENIASGGYSAVGGGYINRATMAITTVAGGWMNTANGNYSTVGGGVSNIAGSGGSSVVSGGSYNTASGTYSAIPGGNYNTASGYASLAMGNYATAQAAYSTVLGQFNVISGNSGAWINTDPLFVVGNGTNAASPSNALTVLKNGDTTVSGKLTTAGGFIIETRTTNPGSPATGQMWLCTDTGDATPCNGI